MAGPFAAGAQRDPGEETLMKTLIFFGLFFAAFLGLVAGAVSPLIAIAMFMVLFPLIFVLRDFRAGVVMVLILVPFSSVSLVGHLYFLSTPEVLIGLTFGSFLLGWILDQRQLIMMPRIMWWRYLLPIGIALCIGMTHLGEMSPLLVLRIGGEFGSKFKYLVEYGLRPMLFVLVAFMLANAVRTSAKPERFLIPIAISLALFCAMLLTYIALSGLGLTAIGGSRARNFLSPLGMHANEFGAFFGIGFVIFLFVLPSVRGLLSRVLVLALLGLSLIALLLTFSRGGYVLVAIGAAYFMFSRSQFKLAIWTGVALVAVVMLMPQEFADRATTGLGAGKGGHDVMSRNTNDDELTAGRAWLWRQTFPAFYKSPLIGSGIASQAWSDAVRNGIVPTSQTHSFYLSMLYDTGLIGLTVMMSFFVFVFRSFRQVAASAAAPPQIRAAMQGAAAALVGYGVMAFTNGLFWPRVENVMLWCMFGICAAYLPKLEAEKKQMAELAPAV